MITIDLIDNLPIDLDPRTADVGGSFYYDPLRVYSATPHRWAWERLKAMPTATLLDVGSSTGCYALLAKHHPGLTVYAFEPVPLTFDILHSNVEANGLQDRVHVYPHGIADYCGEGVCHCVYPIGGSGVSMVNGVPRDDKKFNDVTVPVYTIDDFCQREGVAPDMIKIDTEGGELAVLIGAEGAILRYKPLLIIEYEPLNTCQYGYEPSALTMLLDSWGYTYSNPDGQDLLAEARPA